MRVVVEFTDDTYRHARITLLPGWLGRLFGAHVRIGMARRYPRDHDYWCWVATDNRVGDAVTRELEAQTAEPLPKAQVR